MFLLKSHLYHPSINCAYNIYIVDTYINNASKLSRCGFVKLYALMIILAPRED